MPEEILQGAHLPGEEALYYILQEDGDLQSGSALQPGKNYLKAIHLQEQSGDSPR